jgi:hypothetical protein
MLLAIVNDLSRNQILNKFFGFIFRIPLYATNQLIAERGIISADDEGA